MSATEAPETRPLWKRFIKPAIWCRLWHWETGEKMDKDRFRFNLGQVEEKYQEVYHLICNKA